LIKRRFYPKTIKVRKTNYKLKFVKEIKGRVPKGQAIMGYCNQEKKHLVIRDSQTDKEVFSTLLHECLHAIEFEYELKIKHKLVYELEKAIEQLLRDNFIVVPKH
jgi:hypothetical protein